MYVYLDNNKNCLVTHSWLLTWQFKPLWVPLFSSLFFFQNWRLKFTISALYSYFYHLSSIKETIINSWFASYNYNVPTLKTQPAGGNVPVLTMGTIACLAFLQWKFPAPPKKFFLLPAGLVWPFQNSGRTLGLCLCRKNRARCCNYLPIIGTWTLDTVYSKREQ